MMINSNRKKLPIGIQTFQKIIKGGYYYVDKTKFAYQLIEQGNYYFLSRPRRFGKSLFLDTLKELFESNESLFQELYVHDKWDWHSSNPVIRISFGDGVIKSRQELDTRIRYLLAEQRESLGLSENQAPDIAGEFSDLIKDTHNHYRKKVVILVDEYDKPILDNLTDSPIATEVRDGLKNLYSVIKGADPYLRFCLLTGVSKFSKVSLFSGLNNLNDITLYEPYGSVCGYTETDIDTVFAPELDGLNRSQIRQWYNGYNWVGEGVYNPFDILLLFQKRQFAPYWFESATPTFLVNVLAERGLYTPQLSQLQTNLTLLGKFDVADIATEALLFQTGYLTIKSIAQPLPNKYVYTLGYPNKEVEISLNEALLPIYGQQSHEITRHQSNLIEALQHADFDLLEAHLKSLFASLPHDWYRNNPIAKYEGHYASVFYSHFAALGLDLTVEDASNNGKVDMALVFNGQVLLFEFKVVEQIPDGSALQQLIDRGYADKYRSRDLPIYLIGVEFSKERRQIIAFDIKPAE